MDFVKTLAWAAAPYSGHIVAAVALQVVTVLATLYLPDLNAQIIDEGITQADIPYIWRVGGVMLVVALVQGLAAIGAVWFSARTAMGTGRAIRRAVYSRVNGFNAEDLARFGTPTLITRGTNDVQQIQMTFLLFLALMVPAPIMGVGGVVMALRQGAGLSWIVAVAIAVLFAVVGVLVAVLMPMFKAMQARLDAINGVLREQIAGVRVVRAFVREEHETERFTDANRAITRVSLNIGRVFVLLFPLIMLILDSAIAAVVWFGGQRVGQGEMEVGALTAFIQYIMQILVAFVMGTFMVMMLPRALVCARRVREVLLYESVAQQRPRTARPATNEGVVEFRGVSYSYPGAEEPVLHDISFTARPGTTTALIGSTGAGKSTLVSLLPRLREATSGHVLIDATDVTALDRSDLVQRVSMVPQKPYLFSGTVASNLRMGNPDATDAELWEALDTAQAEFVEDLDMPISQGGTNVSGGQRQRLCIARMLVARPKVYIFDDSFSALDAITDAKVREAMQAYTRDATVLVVAQRVASISNADQILVLEAGRIVARGTHDELLDSSSTYREIVASQQEVSA
ncbi:ABC transporter ATP-binding protein [Corynebacterium auris]|uniref:ABC transporter ATP-binding protein n=1 Tax=Corynebacterium auris TaxID=44750 RepID=UPI0025B3FAC4|nr:ABC transporter ATP-binding protein [Corynebacterium auris]WJY68907.1 putative ABC transporter ATP-binding protein [Corynebacterium auris]